MKKNYLSPMLSIISKLKQRKWASEHRQGQETDMMMKTKIIIRKQKISKREGKICLPVSLFE